MMRPLPAFVLAAGLVAGCANTAEQFAQAKDSWQLAHFDDVVRQWGAPARSTKLSDGSDAHTWVAETAAYRAGGPSVGVGVGSGGYGRSAGVGISIPFGSAPPPDKCERTLIFRDARVVEQNWVGDEGYCSNFRRPQPAPAGK